jgi:1-acyl-sn-glycerol-3-phosphate acyltransferase
MSTGGTGWRGRFRIGAVLLALVPSTLVLMAIQVLALRFGWAASHRLPVVFHRMVCRLLRVRVTVKGEPARGRPLLIVSNHVSWIDITAIATVMPISFIAKSEVAGWPVFGTFARLQRTVFIDRTRRKGAAEANRVVAERLADGDAMVLFAEGTTSDGNRVLPFRSAVIGAARDAIAEAGHTGHVLVQPLTIAYGGRGGLPLSRRDRPGIAWYGDMDLLPHLAAIMAGPPLDAVLSWGEPVAFDTGTDRKAVTRRLQSEIQSTYARLTHGSGPPI